MWRSFSVRYVSNPYKTQQMCHKAAADCLDALTFVPDWRVTDKMIKKLFTALYGDENILQFTLMKIQVFWYFIVLKSVFLI